MFSHHVRDGLMFRFGELRIMPEQFRGVFASVQEQIDILNKVRCPELW